MTTIRRAVGRRARTFRRLLGEDGSQAALREAYRVLRGSAPGFAGLYWAIAPRWYRRRVESGVEDYAAPTDVFKRVEVDPTEITTLTGRPYDPPPDRWRVFGCVDPGSWDRGGSRPIPHEQRGPPSYPELFHAESFEATMHHRSLRAHFHRGVPWEETAFFVRAEALVEEGRTVWQESRSREDLLQRGERVDALYEAIRDDGMRSVVDMARRGETLRSFPHAVSNEILVDIGRDGQLLFANGRHRLSIAKILDLDRVPVAILVRHPAWMTERDRAYRGAGGLREHPDFAEFAGGTSGGESTWP